MRRAWISVFGILGIVTTNCLGFTVERSNAGVPVSPKNWSGPIFSIDRRATIEKIFNGGIHPVDIENILRDSEMVELSKIPEEKCSSSSEVPQRAKRSEDIFNAANHLTSVEKIASEPKESSIVSSTSTMNKTSEITADKMSIEPKVSTIVSSSSTNMKTPEIIAEKMFIEPKESTIVSSTSPKTKIPEISADKMSVDLKESTIVSSRSAGTKTPEISSEKSVNSEKLKNIVLLFIDDAGTGHKHYLKNFEAANKFPIQKLLQNCRSTELPGVAKFSLGDSLVSEKRDEDCECDRFLRANIGSLLSWARHGKEMTTAAVSVTNFSIPLSMSLDSPASQFAKDFEDNDEVNLLPRENPHLKSEPRDNWRLIDLDKQSSPSASATTGWLPNAKQDGINGYDGIWDVFDVFSKIRIAFFRILLESLSNMTGSDDDLNGKRPFAIQPSLVELVTDAIRELKSVPNDKGFVLVAATSGNELSAAVEVIQREITTNDTLLVIAGICSPANEPVPFFARGPSEKSLLEAHTIWDLPGLVRGALTNDCKDESCKDQRREKPRALPSHELPSLPQDLPRKRVGRATSEEDSSDSTTDEKSTKKPDDDSQGTPEGGKRSGAQDIQVDNVAKIFGIVTSVAAMLAFNSS